LAVLLEPVAFLSYVWLDDEHEEGRLSEFRRRLAAEVRMQTGRPFDIFQDRKAVGWGEQWKQRIEESLDAATFLIPIVTPGFFNSSWCRTEFERFLERERQLGRKDLILPVYYVDSSILSDEARRQADPVASEIAARQFADWRELRFEPFTAPIIGKTLAQLAKQIVAALERDRPPAKPAPVAADKSARQVSGAAASEPAGAGATVSAPARKNEPPTHIVDALYQGDYATITAALQAARPGHRILVRRGLYRESLVIDKPVEIIGDGELGEAVIEGVEGSAISFQTSMGRIANLALRQIGAGKHFCIDITQGRLDLEGCDITSQALACVAIRNGADPRLRRNRIHHGKQGGVFVYGNGLGTLEDNEIFANAMTGVEISKGGNPTLRRNRIHNGKTCGVAVYEDGLGTLEENEIFGNAYAGVQISGGGNPTLRRNRIHDARETGVFVTRNGLGTLEDNEIFANASMGVAISEGGNPTLRRNRIAENGYQAVWINDGGQGTFEDNDLRGNARDAWDIAEDCEDKVIRRRNQE
jgi:parallel beta-helix repeat protein